MKKKSTKIEGPNAVGPNTGFILQAMKLLKKGKNLIHLFGTEYRTYPVKITGITKKEGGLQISGNLDYSEFPKLTQSFNGKPATITDYNPQTKSGFFVC
jgi:hypothetical protein